MSGLTRKEIAAALRIAGLAAGDRVLVFSDLSRLGPVEGARTRDIFCQTYLDAIQDVIQPDGTLVVPTYTTQVARYDEEFIWESTPAVTGVFAEYVRTRPGALRSLHPLHSLTALGPDSTTICADNGTHNFGWHSPFHRLHVGKAKILSLGLTSGYALGIAHYVEAMYGLPNIYNKLLKWAPIVNGQRDPRQFFAAARHLGLRYAYDFNRWVRQAHAEGILRGAPLGRAAVFVADFADAFDMAASEVRRDPWYMLAAAPDFVYGEVPFDGPTQGRDGQSQLGGPAIRRDNAYVGLNVPLVAAETDRIVLGI